MDLARSLASKLPNGVTLTLFKTTTSELLNNGFSKGDQTKAINDDPLFARDVYLLYEYSKKNAFTVRYKVTLSEPVNEKLLTQAAGKR